MQASSSISQNGDDAIELFYMGSVIETFGDINVDGTATPWEYLDSWAYKDSSGSVSFSGGNWIFGGVDCTDGSTTTYNSSCPYPLCPLPAVLPVPDPGPMPKRFFFDVGILERPDIRPMEDNGTSDTIVLSKDEGNAGNTKFRICKECNNRTLKTENGCDSCMDCGYSKCDK